MKPNDEALDVALSVTQIPEENMREYMRRILTAAYAAQFKSEDYAGLIEALRKVEPDLPGDRTRWYRNPNGPDAADALEAVLAEREAWKGRQEATAAILKQVETERDALKKWKEEDSAAMRVFERYRELEAERDALVARNKRLQETFRYWNDTYKYSPANEVPPILEAAAIPDLVEFSKHKNWELKYKQPLYCDDRDQEKCWVVYEMTGSINDREWEPIGKGETAAEAIAAAIRRGK